MTLLLIALGLYFAWHWLRAVEQRRSAERHARPYAEQYRPPPIVYREPELTPAPALVAGHEAAAVRDDRAGEQVVAWCTCGARLCVTREAIESRSWPMPRHVQGVDEWRRWAVFEALLEHGTAAGRDAKSTSA